MVAVVYDTYLSILTASFLASSKISVGVSGRIKYRMYFILVSRYLICLLMNSIVSFNSGS